MSCLFACLELLAVSHSLFLVNSGKLRRCSASKYSRVTSPLLAPFSSLVRTTQQRDQNRVPVKKTLSHMKRSVRITETTPFTPHVPAMLSVPRLPSTQSGVPTSLRQRWSVKHNTGWTPGREGNVSCSEHTSEQWPGILVTPYLLLLNNAQNVTNLITSVVSTSTNFILVRRAAHPAPALLPSPDKPRCRGRIR